MSSEDEPLKFRSDRSAVVLLLETTASADRVDELQEMRALLFIFDHRGMRFHG